MEAFVVLLVFGFHGGRLVAEAGQRLGDPFGD
jgi:hypothetical protein